MQYIFNRLSVKEDALTRLRTAPCPALSLLVRNAVSTFGMWTPHVRKHRPGIVSLIAVSTALAMIAANTMLALLHTVCTALLHLWFTKALM